MRLQSADFELEEDEAPDSAAPSSQELLRRARLGPMRTAWESIVAPSDPILHMKMKPRVAERRARFTKVVKATLGGCLALCLLALVVSFVSSPEETAYAATAAAGKTAPTRLASDVVPLSIEPHGKAKRHVRRAAKAHTRKKHHARRHTKTRRHKTHRARRHRR